MISVTDDQLKGIKVSEYAAAIKEPYASSDYADFTADEEEYNALLAEYEEAVKAASEEAEEAEDAAEGTESEGEGE